MVRRFRAFKYDHLIILVFGILFAVLVYGQLGLLKTGEIAYPANSAISIEKIAIDNQSFFDQLDQAAKASHVSIYKTITVNGRAKGYVFGDQPDNQNLVQDKAYLAQLPVIGDYYLDGKLTPQLKQVLTGAHANYKQYSTGWQLILLDLLGLRSLRSASFWMSLILLMMSAFALKIKTTRKAMIQKHLGRLRGVTGFSYIGLLASYSASGLILLVANGYFASLFMTAYGLMSAVVLVLLGLTLGLVDVIYYIYLSAQAPLAILKHRYLGRYFAWVWLVVLLASMVMMTSTLEWTVKTYQANRIRQQSLAPWQQLSHFASVSYQLPDFVTGANAQDGQVLDQKQAWSDYTAQWRAFDDQFDKQQKIMIGLPSLRTDMAEYQAPTYYMIPYPDPDDVTHLTKIDTRIKAHIYQVSPSLIDLSQRVFEANPTIYQDRTAVTVYLPQRYQAQKSVLTRLILAEFTGANGSELTSKEIEFVTLPSSFKLFVPEISQLRNSDQPIYQIANEVLVQYDDSKLAHSPLVNEHIQNRVLTTYYQADQIDKAIAKSGLDPLKVSYQDVFSYLKTYQLQAQQDLVRAVCIGVSLFVAQGFVLYSYCKVQLGRVAKRLVLIGLFGRDYWPILCRQVTIPMLGLVLCYSLGTYLGQPIVLAAGVYVGYLIMLGLVMLLALHHLKQKQVAILKGEQEGV